MNLNAIVDTVADFYNVPRGVILSRQRTRHVADARQICMYLARLTPQVNTCVSIGRFFGRDHSTIVVDVRAISERMEREDWLRDQIRYLERVAYQRTREVRDCS